MSYHIMIDIETLGTRPDAQILQIGAVAFDPVSGGKIKTNQAFNEYVKVQDGAGTIDHSTLEFWMSQPNKHHMVEGMKKSRSFDEVCFDFFNWPSQILGVEWWDIGGVWAKGPDFDLAIIKSAMAKIGFEPPWRYNVARDVRTFGWVVGGLPDIDRTGLIDHHAVDDAVGQCQQVQKMSDMIGKYKREVIYEVEKQLFNLYTKCATRGM